MAMHLNPNATVVLAVAFLVVASPGMTQIRDAEVGDAAAEAAARQALETFITQWNTADDANLRRAMHFPFVTVAGHPHLFMTAAGGFSVAESSSDGPRPNFDRMRADEHWHLSSIDALEPSVVTRNKVHFELTFTRWHPDGTRYWTVPALRSVTRAGDHWGIQVRSLMPATFDARDW